MTASSSVNKQGPGTRCDDGSNGATSTGRSEAEIADLARDAAKTVRRNLGRD